MPTTTAPRRRRASRPTSSSAAAVSATAMRATPSGTSTRRWARVATAPASTAAPMKSWPSRSATIGTNSSPPRTRTGVDGDTVDLDVGSRCRPPPVAAAMSVARKRTAADLPVGPSLVLRRCPTPTGSVSSCCSAAGRPSTRCRATRRCNVLAAVDRDRYDVVPVGITRDGRWVVGRRRHRRRCDGRRHGAPLPRRRRRRRPSSSRCRRCRRATGERSSSCRCCTARWARTAPCRACSSWPASPYVGAGVAASAVCMDKGLAKDVLAAARPPQCRHLAVGPAARRPRLRRRGRRRARAARAS